jgi:hypothetical protein
MNRRNFLKCLGVLGMVLSTGPNIKPGLEETIPEANRILRAFPQVIPGARSVIKYETPGAKHCLVHIMQMHLSDPEDLSAPTQENGKIRINYVQRNIYNILEALKQNSMIDSVYLDGMAQEYWESITSQNRLEGLLSPGNESITEDIKKTQSEFNALIEAGYFDVSKEQLRCIREKLEDKKRKLKQFNEQYKYLRGGAERLVYEGKLEPRFEDPIAVKKANETYERIKESRKKGETILDVNQAMRDLKEIRENKLLERIANEGRSLAITNLGAGHAFGGIYSFPGYQFFDRISEEDNIYKWNILHPDLKFSLIEIIPKGYKSREDKR